MTAAAGPGHDPLLCADGCGRRWVTNFGRAQCRACANAHLPASNPPPRQVPMPLSPAAQHWQDAKERDDSPVPF